VPALTGKLSENASADTTWPANFQDSALDQIVVVGREKPSLGLSRRWMALLLSFPEVVRLRRRVPAPQEPLLLSVPASVATSTAV